MDEGPLPSCFTKKENTILRAITTTVMVELY